MFLSCLLAPLDTIEEEPAKSPIQLHFWSLMLEECHEQFGTRFGREVMDFFELPHLKQWPIRYFETTYEVNNLEPVLEAKLWISLSCHIWNDDLSDILKCTKWTIWNQFWKRSNGFLRVATFETMTNPIFWNVRSEQFGSEVMDFFELQPLKR